MNRSADKSFEGWLPIIYSSLAARTDDWTDDWTDACAMVRALSKKGGDGGGIGGMGWGCSVVLLT